MILDPTPYGAYIPAGTVAVVIVILCMILLVGDRKVR